MLDAQKRRGNKKKMESFAYELSLLTETNELLLLVVKGNYHKKFLCVTCKADLGIINSDNMEKSFSRNKEVPGNLLLFTRNLSCGKFPLSTTWTQQVYVNRTQEDGFRSCNFNEHEDVVDQCKRSSGEELHTTYIVCLFYEPQ